MATFLAARRTPLLPPSSVPLAPPPRRPQRRVALAGLVIVAALAYLIVTSFSAAVAAVVSPGQVLQRGAAVYGQTVRLQGRVVGDATTTPTTLAHVFRVAAGRASVLVTYSSDLPGGFRAGAAVEAQGTYNGHLFTATTLTAKCPTKYQAAPTRT